MLEEERLAVQLVDGDVFSAASAHAVRFDERENRQWMLTT